MTTQDEMRAVGDLMQSAFSRVLAALVDAEDAEGQGGVALPLDYEAQMAVLEGRGAIDRWTELRRQEAWERDD